MQRIKALDPDTYHRKNQRRIIKCRSRQIRNVANIDAYHGNSPAD